MRPASPFQKLCVQAFILWLTFSNLSACSQAAPSPAPLINPTAALSQPLAAPTASPTPVSTPEAAPTATILARASYQLNLKFNYARHTADVSEKIIYPNHTGEALKTLALLVEPNRYANSFQIQSITRDEQPVSDYTLEKNNLTLPLSQPLAPGQQVTLDLQYHLDLPAIPDQTATTRPVPYGYTERQTNLVDWFPCLPPYKTGQGWLLHTPGYYGEHQVYDVSDYQVNLEMSGAAQGTLVAASAPAQQAGASYHYQLDRARTFVLSASPEYKLSQKTVGSVTILNYYFPFNPAAGESTLKDTADAVGLYSNLFGPYPHTTLSVVEADFMDGMEYDGLFFLSRGFYNLYDGTPKGYLTAIAVHETAHQWWFGVVGNDQAMEPWLDEAMATYTERIFYAKTYPELVDWWWAVRVKFYQPSGMINLPIYDYGGFTPYRNAVYLNGAQFFEDLRLKMGDDAFYAFLKDYTTQETDKISTRQDFFRILALHTQANLQELIAKYFK
jgi:hypothetical protein